MGALGKTWQGYDRPGEVNQAWIALGLLDELTAKLGLKRSAKLLEEVRAGMSLMESTLRQVA